MEAIDILAGILLAVGWVYLTLAQFVGSVRDLRNSRESRVMFYAGLVAIPLMIGSCAAVERLSGISPYGQPPSFVIRRAVAVVFITLYVVFVWWYAVYPESRRRRLFLRGNLCPVCNRPLQAKRVNHPVVEGGEPSLTHWLHRCDCGELTLYDGQGRAHHLYDRTGGPNAG